MVDWRGPTQADHGSQNSRTNSGAGNQSLNILTFSNNNNTTPTSSAGAEVERERENKSNMKTEQSNDCDWADQNIRV